MPGVREVALEVVPDTKRFARGEAQGVIHIPHTAGQHCLGDPGKALNDTKGVLRPHEPAGSVKASIRSIDPAPPQQDVADMQPQRRVGADQALQFLND
jgi:hypothetical protein